MFVRTIHILCGVVAAGKTTLARRLAEDLPAARLSRDEWMLRLFGLAYDDPRYAERLEPCTELLWDVALEIVRAGSNVVLDWNFWSRRRRADAAARAASAGASVELHWVDVPLDEAMRRARMRTDRHSHRVDEDGVRHLATIFEPPSDAEGMVVRRHTPE